MSTSSTSIGSSKPTSAMDDAAMRFCPGRILQALHRAAAFLSPSRQAPARSRPTRDARRSPCRSSAAAVMLPRDLRRILTRAKRHANHHQVEGEDARM
eukprot:CAMPEP_0198716354 /NCGR_PEP_ID=MMETSP1471-20131121/37714_1 /TAXON_ID=41880 /ORGANISM="Pycnococcus provasolii, Strain RCC733" /LENGTH=97 /DNA_ID=CAMNT_0044476869 /DNA_START=189 /DNA_END=483 /DNA_ORIENTATION=-